MAIPEYIRQRMAEELNRRTTESLWNTFHGYADGVRSNRAHQQHRDFETLPPGWSYDISPMGAETVRVDMDTARPTEQEQTRFYRALSSIARRVINSNKPPIEGVCKEIRRRK